MITSEEAWKYELRLTRQRGRFSSIVGRYFLLVDESRPQKRRPIFSDTRSISVIRHLANSVVRYLLIICHWLHAANRTLQRLDPRHFGPWTLQYGFVGSELGSYVEY